MDLTINCQMRDGKQILKAMTDKGGRGVLTRLAKENDISKAYLSDIIHGRRRNKNRILIIANYLDVEIYGVHPVKND